MKDEEESKELLSTKPYKCSMCGERFSKQQTNFPASHSPFFSGNNNYLTICNSCFNNSTDQYQEILGSQDEAIKRMCLHWDMYLSESTLNSVKKIDINRSRIKEYVKQLNLSQNAWKTYDDYMKECESDAITCIEDLENINEDGSIKVKANSVKIWGFGFSPEDYEYMNNQFSDWKSRVVVDSKAREVLVRELCKLELQKNNALLEGKVDLYQKLVDTYQKTLDRANLTPKQEDANDKASEKPMGVMIDMFENEHPIPEPNEEWKDVDGIIKLLTIYFLGHLCKMLGLKNRYSKMYEEEMDKYRVSIPELEETDDEDVFDFLVNNGASLDKILDENTSGGESNGNQKD